MRILELQKIHVQRFSCHDDGLHLELCRADQNGNLDEGPPYPLATIRADKGDQRTFEFISGKTLISLPLSELERVIDIAKQEVHSEDYYD